MTSTPNARHNHHDSPRAVWPDLLMALAVLGWITVPPILAYGGLIAAAPFFGEIPTAADQADSTRLWVGAATALVAFPALGLWCAARQRRRAATVLFGLGVSLSLVVLVVVLALSVRDRPKTPAPRPPGACQELSGGDTRCPGG